MMGQDRATSAKLGFAELTEDSLVISVLPTAETFQQLSFKNEAPLPGQQESSTLSVDVKTFAGGLRL